MSLHLTSVCVYWLGLYWFVSTPFVVFAQSDFTLNGSASILNDNCYRLTSFQQTNDVGSIWSDYTVDLRNALDFQFAVNFGCSKAVGEGVAFVLHTHQHGRAALGCGNGAMGFANRAGCATGAIMPSLAIELDVRYNAADKDIYRPHLTLVKNGNLSEPMTAVIPMLEGGKSVLDCEYHHVRITWLPSKQELCVYIDGNLRLAYTGDLSNEVFGGSSDIYYGFTASSSSQAAGQMVCVQGMIEEVDAQLQRKLSFEQSIGIYTNPQREKLTVDIRLPDDDYLQVQLFDISGRVIYEIPAHLVRQNQYHFNLPGLPSGVYYISVTNGTERVSKRIVHIASMRA